MLKEDKFAAVLTWMSSLTGCVRLFLLFMMVPFLSAFTYRVCKGEVYSKWTITDVFVMR